MTVRIPALFVLTVVGLTVVGCGSGGSSPSQSSAAQGQTNSGASESSGAAMIDACALIPAEDITRLLGVPITGQPTSTNPKFPPGCMWKNPANEESVSLEIGNPGTAPGDALPKPEEGFEVTTPGPDGMQFLGPGSVVFAAGGRSNTVQVAVLSMLSGDKANDAAVELARKVGPQLPE